MKVLYEIDYNLPFVPRLASRYKPLLFVNAFTRKMYYCMYNDGKELITATGLTPVEALEQWVRKVEKNGLGSVDSKP